MTKQQQNTVSHKIAKALVCLFVLVLVIPGITLLTVASVIVWFYGEDLLSGEVMKHFKLIENFLPRGMTEDETS